MSNERAPDAVDQILRAERTRWPRWRHSAQKPAPGWFRGKELDALEPTERRQLYEKTRSSMQSAWVVPILLIPAATTLTILHKGHTQIFMGLCILYLALILISPLLRRMSMLTFARRSLLGSADWPLINLRQTLRESADRPVLDRLSLPPSS
jgi:hypothetical protein